MIKQICHPAASLSSLVQLVEITSTHVQTSRFRSPGTKTLDSKTQTDFHNAMGSVRARYNENRPTHSLLLACRFRIGGRPADFTELLHPPELNEEEKAQFKQTADKKLKRMLTAWIVIL